MFLQEKQQNLFYLIVLDIFPFYEKNGIMTKNTWFKTHRQDSEFPAHYLKPLTTLGIGNVAADRFFDGWRYDDNDHVFFLNILLRILLKLFSSSFRFCWN